VLQETKAYDDIPALMREFDAAMARLIPVHRTNAAGSSHARLAQLGKLRTTVVVDHVLINNVQPITCSGICVPSSVPPRMLLAASRKAS
jgi:hypothetical protein